MVTQIRSIDDLLFVLGKVKKIDSKEYQALCPAHNDKVPSLHIRRNENKILLSCKAGCTNESIVKALGLTMADLFLDEEQYPASKPTATFPYLNLDGSTRYIIKRFPNLPNGKKVFKAYMPDGAEGIGDTPRILYQAPEVIKAKEKGETIYVVEGEKDAETLRDEGLVATTPPFGVNSKWLPEYTDLLKGANVVILPDTDLPGLKKGTEIASALQGSVASLKLFQLNGCKDISEFFDKGAPIESFLEMVEEEPEYIPSPEVDNTNLMESDNIGDIFSFRWAGKRIRAEVSVIKESLSGLSCEVVFRPLDSPKPYIRNIVNLLKASEKATFVKSLQAKREDIKCDELLEEATEEVIKKYREGEEAIDLDMVEAPQASKYRLYPFIEEGEITTYYGAHETLKSYKMYYDAILIQNGLNIDGVRAEKGNVLILDFETHKFAGRERVRAIIKGLRKQGLRSPVYRKCSRPIPLDIINIQRLVLKHDIKVVFVDSVGISCGGDATSQEVMTAYYRALRSLGITVVTIDHEPRDANNIYGSVYKEIIARDVFETIRRDTEEDTTKLVIIKHTKTNNRSRIPLISFKFEFDGDEDFTETVTVSREEAPEIATVFGSKEAKDTLVAFFKRTQNIPDFPRNIAVQTKLKPGTTRQTLKRWRGEVFERLEDGRWKLVLLV